MTDKESFDKSYHEAQKYFNLQMKLNITAEIETFDPRPYNLRILAVVCLMLVINGQGQKGGKKARLEPNIYSLNEYDLNQFSELTMFDPYIKYLMSLGQRGKNIDEYKMNTASAANRAVTKAKYVATFIRFLFVLQQKDVKLEPTYQQ
jgi:hypothetical protein